MDCGPAALKCAARRPRHPGQLRPAARGLPDRRRRHVDRHARGGRRRSSGSTPSRSWCPLDHLLLPEAAALPAIVVVRLAERPDPLRRRLAAPRPLRAGDGPGGGRRWMTARAAARASSTSTGCRCRRPPGASGRAPRSSRRAARAPARARRQPRGGRARRSRARPRDPTGAALAALDAATRMAAVARRPGGLAPRRRGRARVLDRLPAQIARDAGATALIPERYWSVRPADAPTRTASR